MGDEDAGRFGKGRIEALCDGVFAIAMTLLVLELKVPELPRTASSADIWRELGSHPLPFVGFALTFLLTGQFWILHHLLFRHLREVNRALTLLSLPFMMFISLLPFSTSMLTAFGLAKAVGLVFYFGNQWMLAALLALQWIVARRNGLLTGDSGQRRRQFEILILGEPAAFALALVVAAVAPRQAMNAMVVGHLALAVASRKVSQRLPA